MQCICLVMIFIGGAGVPVSCRTSDMAAALLKFFTRWRDCPCTNPDKEHFPVIVRDDALRGEFELSTSGDVEWLLFSYT